jgi:type IX secretion system PorP/SprF family membrane protein
MKQFYFLPFYIFLILVFTENTITQAQDIHLSQYNSSPQNLNPAQTGLFNGDWRLAGNYRNQWAAIANVPFNTYSFSGDTKIASKSKSGTPAIGFLINSDKSGDSKLKSTQIAISFAYILKLTKDSAHRLSLGIQPGFTNKNFNANSATFDEQFDGSKYNSSLSSGENFPSNSITYIDVGAGAAYYWQKTARKKVNIGVSAFHLNQPSQSFYGSTSDSSKLAVKYNFSGIAEIPLGSKFGILPSFLIQLQGASKETLLGLFGKYYLTSIDQTTTSISLGAFIRSKDAYALMVNMEYQNVTVGVSYDINYSNLAAASNNKGAFELSVIYIHKKNSPIIAPKRSYPQFM